MAIITNNIEWSQSSSLRINTSNENNNQGGEEQEEQTHHDKLAEGLFMTHLSVILSRRTKGGNEEKEKDNQQETTDKWAVE